MNGMTTRQLHQNVTSIYDTMDSDSHVLEGRIVVDREGVFSKAQPFILLASLVFVDKIGSFGTEVERKTKRDNQS